MLRKTLVGSLAAFEIMLMGLASQTAAQEQVRFSIDSRSSLAWWQVMPGRYVQPETGRLWATTCPEDPTWQPGDGAGAGHRDQALTDPNAHFARRHIKPVCGEAVSGTFVSDDGPTLQGVRGVVVVRADALVTGLRMRDVYARKALLQTGRYPEIRFAIDSLETVHTADTIQAVVHGAFELRGVREPMSVPVQVWRETETLRVRGNFEVPARDLVEKYGMSRMALGLAVDGGWRAVRMGIDVVLRTEAAILADGGTSFLGRN